MKGELNEIMCRTLSTTVKFPLSHLHSYVVSTLRVQKNKLRMLVHAANKNHRHVCDKS